MYKNIKVDINERIIKFTNDINIKYIDYKLFDLIFGPRLEFNYESFNMDLSDFKNLSNIIIESKVFNQPIPQLNLLTELTVQSDDFDQPLSKLNLNSLTYLYIGSAVFNHPQLNSLTWLYIESKVFNQTIPQLERLSVLTIKSNAFNKEIPELKEINKIMIVSDKFKQSFPTALPKLKKLYIISPVFSSNDLNQRINIYIKDSSDNLDMVMVNKKFKNN